MRVRGREKWRIGGFQGIPKVVLFCFCFVFPTGLLPGKNELGMGNQYCIALKCDTHHVSSEPGSFPRWLSTGLLLLLGLLMLLLLLMMKKLLLLLGEWRAGISAAGGLVRPRATRIRNRKVSRAICTVPLLGWSSLLLLLLLLSLLSSLLLSVMVVTNRYGWF